MKKTIANILFLVVCIAGIIFLLLPFLETTPPATTQLHSAQPQISSSNPLATIARRLASIFGKPKKERAGQSFSARDGYDVTSPEFLTFAAAPSRQAALQPDEIPSGSLPEPDGNQQIPVPPVTQEEYGNAALQTQEGEWVLIRQTAPQAGVSGMHEVNIHENPYDRYMKQEQARRFQPPARHADIPHSKWARLLRPVKQFFGIESAQPVGNSSLALYREHDIPHGSTSLSMGKNTSLSGYGRTRVPWPDISPDQWARMTPKEREHERERRSTAEFIEILSGSRTAEEAAAIEAEAKYPNPKDEGKREQYRKRLTEENKQAIKEGLLEAMRANAQGQEVVDELEHIMSGCANASLPKPNCNPDKQAQNAPLFSEEESEAIREQSRKTFFDMTKYVMPNDLPLLPVLGPSDPQTIANMGGLDDVEKTVEIYKFLYEKKNCAEKDCFWIPNTLQSNSHLNDAVILANAKLVTDPDNTYPGFEGDFEEYKVKLAREQQTQEGEQMPSEQQIREDAKKQFTENAVNWLPVTPDELQRIHRQHTINAADPKNAETDISLAVPYLTNPVYAEQMYHIFGDSPVFGYALQPLTAVKKAATGSDESNADKQIVINTAELIVPSLAKNVRTAFKVMEGVTQHAVTEGTRAGINQGITQFNQSGQDWGDMLKAVHSRNQRNQPAGKK